MNIYRKTSDLKTPLGFFVWFYTDQNIRYSIDSFWNDYLSREDHGTSFTGPSNDDIQTAVFECKFQDVNTYEIIEDTIDYKSHLSMLLQSEFNNSTVLLKRLDESFDTDKSALYRYLQVKLDKIYEYITNNQDTIIYFDIHRNNADKLKAFCKEKLNFDLSDTKPFFNRIFNNKIGQDFFFYLVENWLDDKTPVKSLSQIYHFMSNPKGLKESEANTYKIICSKTEYEEFCRNNISDKLKGRKYTRTQEENYDSQHNLKERIKQYHRQIST